MTIVWKPRRVRACIAFLPSVDAGEPRVFQHIVSQRNDLAWPVVVVVVVFPRLAVSGIIDSRGRYVEVVFLMSGPGARTGFASLLLLLLCSEVDWACGVSDVYSRTYHSFLSV